MRKVSVLIVVALLILGSAFASAASLPLNGDNPWHTGRLKGFVFVKGTVGPYAAIDVIDGFVNLDWLGYEREVDYGQAMFEIRSNTAIKLAAEWAPLTTVVPGLFGPETYQIATNVNVSRLDQGLWGMPIYTLILSGWAMPGGGLASYETIGLPVQAVDKKVYAVSVGGMLGDIHHQAAGDYGTMIKFTVSAF